MSEDFDKPLTSPDGLIRIEFKITGGDREPEFLNPRVVNAASGEVLVDLWETGWAVEWQPAEAARSTLKLSDYYTKWTCEMKFIEIGKLRLTLTHPVSGSIEIADINDNTKTFALAQNPEKRESLISFIPWLNQLTSPSEPPAPPAPRWEMFLTLLGCLVFAAICIWIVFYDREAVFFAKLVALVGIVICGLGAVLSVMGILRKL